MENLERDIENLSIYGVSGMANLQFQAEVLVQSKFIANAFSNIISDVQTQDIAMVASAMERLRSMFDVLCYSTQRFELVEITDHLRRIFDLLMSSNLMEIFGTILDQPDDLKVSPIKLEVLRVIALLSVGGRLFSQSDISLTPIPEEQDQQLL